MKVYCIFCKSGAEDMIAEKIAKLSPELEAIIPVRTLEEKRNGIWESTKKHLIPGYIFLYTSEKSNLSNAKLLLDVYRVLDYGADAPRELAGCDYQYAMWIYRHCGNIETSRVIMEGSRVRVVDGPLVDVVGKIVRIDRHKRRAWVEVDFYGRKQTISLSIDGVTSSAA